MRLRLKQTSEAVIIFREKWGTLAFAAVSSLACALFPIWFYWLMGDHAGSSKPFLIAFCSVFCIAGLAFLSRLPLHFRQALADNGVQFVVVDRTGIALTPNLGSEKKHYDWLSVKEVVLAEKLKIIDSDGTVFLWRSVVVFLDKRSHNSLDWLKKIQEGISISGKGRPYLLAGYPRGESRTLECAIRPLVPDTVSVCRVREVVFDTRKANDFYSETL